MRTIPRIYSVAIVDWFLAGLRLQLIVASIIAPIIDIALDGWLESWWGLTIEVPQGCWHIRCLDFIRVAGIVMIVTIMILVCTASFLRLLSNSICH